MQYSDEVPFFSGTHIFKADDVVIEKLSEQLVSEGIAIRSKDKGEDHFLINRRDLIYGKVDQYILFSYFIPHGRINKINDACACNSNCVVFLL